MRTVTAHDLGEFLARIIHARNQHHVLVSGDDAKKRVLGFVDTDAPEGPVRVELALVRVIDRTVWFADLRPLYANTCVGTYTPMYRSDEVLPALGWAKDMLSDRIKVPQGRLEMYQVVPAGPVPVRWED